MSRAPAKAAARQAAATRLGRPRKPETERTVVATVRLKPAHKAKLRALGARWLARQLDATPDPVSFSKT